MHQGLQQSPSSIIIGIVSAFKGLCENPCTGKQSCPVREIDDQGDSMEINQPKKLSWVLTILIAVLICGLSLLGAFVIKNSWSAPAYGEYKAVPLSGNEGVQVSGNGFVYYNGSSLASVSSRGKVQWTYMVGANASFKASASGVASWSGETLTVIDRKTGNTSYTSPMDAEVISAYTGEQYTAALLAPEHNSTIVLIENGGRLVDQIVFADQTVIDYGFFSGGSLFWVMTLDTSGTVPTCAISTYRPGRMIVGSIKDSEQLMYQVMFQSSHVRCAGTTHLKVYDYTGAEIVENRQLIYGWYLAAVDGVNDDPMMALVPDAQYGGSDTMHDVRMMRTDLDQVVRMPFGCAKLVAKGNRIYGFSAEGYIMVAEAGRQTVTAFRTDVPAGEVYGVTDDRVAVVGAGSSAYLVTLP